MLRSAKQDRDDHQAGQASLFGGGDQTAPEPTFQLPKISSWSRMEALENEREVLGIWVSGHPLVESKEVFDQLSRGRDLKALHEMQHDANVSLWVVLSQVRPLTIRQGQNAGAKMAMMTLQDLTDKCEGVIFNDGYSKCATALEKAGTSLRDGPGRPKASNPRIDCQRRFDYGSSVSRALHRIDVNTDSIQSASKFRPLAIFTTTPKW